MERLIIAPHMDDESLGCGGLIMKHPGECFVLTLADSGPQREREQAEALAILGVTRFHNAGLPDGQLGADQGALVALIDSWTRRLRPDELYLPFPSLHQDHIAAYEAGLRSSRVSMSPDHWFPPTVLVYDIAVYDVNLYPTDLRWNVFESLTEAQADAKAAACNAYVSEHPPGDHPMNSVKDLARAAGQTRRVAYAEQFALVRQVRR